MNPVKNTSLLKFAKNILAVLKEKDSLAQPVIIRLNELQVVRRERELNLVEIDELKNIIKENKNDIQIVTGAYILLYAFTEASFQLSEMGENEKKAFLEFPICKFLPQK